MLRVFLLMGCVTIVMAQSNLTELETRVQILENDVTNLENNVDDVENDINGVENDVDINQQQILENTNNIFDISSTVDDTEATILQLVSSVTSLQQAMAELEAVNNNQSLTITELQATVSEQQATIDILEATNNNTVAQLVVVNDSIQDLDSEVSVHDMAILVLTDEMLILEETVDDVEDAMAALEVVNNDILDRLQEVEELVMVPWTACTSSPCQNGGTCVDVNVDTFICMCRDGFFGVGCQGNFIDTLFLATTSESSVTPSDPIVFDLAVLNPGGHYNPNTGIYTVALDGFYQFVFHFRKESDAVAGAYLVVDDMRVAYTYSSEGDYDTADLVFNLDLEAGQEVWIRPYSMDSIGGSAGGISFTWFTGHLIYAA